MNSIVHSAGYKSSQPKYYFSLL